MIIIVIIMLIIIIKLKTSAKWFLEIQTILRLWRMQSLTIEGKITIFNLHWYYQLPVYIGTIKIVYLRFLTGLSIHIIDELINIQINFFWKKTPTKIQA